MRRGPTMLYGMLYALTQLVLWLVTVAVQFVQLARHLLRQPAIIKRPVHLALVIGEDDLCLEDIGRVVAWCLRLEISIVSLYDHEGLLVSDSDRLITCIDAAVQDVDACTPRKYVVRTPVDRHVRQNGLCSTVAKDDIYLVNVLHCRDGKQAIVATVQQLSLSSQNFTEREMTVTDFEKHLDENHYLPSPDLLICCGPTFSPLGFLPWQISNTEIFHLPTHRKMSHRTFLDKIEDFGNCEQRFGL